MLENILPEFQKFLKFFYAKGQIFGGGKICPFARASQVLFRRGAACRTE
jgi:hypothetical protein